MNSTTNLPVLFGAAYYPEAWSDNEQEHDIALMKQAGINVVRMAEFAWSKMEPKENRFDFAWLHKTINKLGQQGIKTILGTPTATPPIWLEEKDPSMRVLLENGVRKQHGGRRHACSSNPTYVKYALRITQKMAKEFGANPFVVGWQLDNEIAPTNNGCFCDNCKKGFEKHLKRRYKTIDELNDRWGNNLWSQNYTRFCQVPMPKSTTFHNPHIKYEWKCFQSDIHVNFIKKQAEILRKYTTAPIGTDMMPVTWLNYEKVAEFVDVMQLNHYNDETNLNHSMFFMDYLRSFKDMPFWNTETSTCWPGATVTPENLRPDGFCNAVSWLPIVLGGGANLYWLWRQHWSGHELMHGSVLYASGKPMHIFNEVKAVADGIKKANDFLTDTKVKTDTAYMISMDTNYLLEVQEIAPRKDPIHRMMRWYYSLTNQGIRPDVIAPQKDLSNYKLLFTPYILTLEIADLQTRIIEWVKKGGTWVVGPLTDIRNDIGAHYTDRSTGILENITGCELVHQVPDAENRNTCAFTDGEEFKTYQWLQLFDLADDCEPIATVTDGFSTLVGKSIAFKKKLGKGSIICIGTQPMGESAKRIIEIALTESGAHSFKTEGKITASLREGEKFKGISALEMVGDPAKLYFDGKMTDILTGNIYENEAEFKPFQAMILSK